MNPYLRLLRIDKPIGIYLLLWPTLWALFLAAGTDFPQIKNLLVFIIGVFLMRSAGCVINDYADRKIDPLIKRTKTRPIAAGEVAPAAALRLFFVLVSVAFLLVLTTNWLTVKWSFAAILLAVFYPLTKRFFPLPQFFLGLAFSISVPMAFAAETENVAPAAWWIFAASVVWAMIYDTMYAIADRAEDRKIGIQSSAIFFGDYDRFAIFVLQILLLVLFFKIGKIFALGGFYDLSLIIVFWMMIYHQRLIKNRQPEFCLRAFFHNHYLGMVVFFGIFVSKFSPFFGFE